MIRWLQGKCIEVGVAGVVLDVSGVGYGLEVPLCDLASMRQGEEVELWVYTLVREDRLSLFGFPSQDRRDVFELLLTVSGVGPRAALAILSTLSIQEISEAINEENYRVFARAPGVGKRTAERLLVELKGKPLIRQQPPGRGRLEVGDLADASMHSFSSKQVVRDLELALLNLGYRSKEIDSCLERLDLASDLDFPAVIKKALSLLGNASVR